MDLKCSELHSRTACWHLPFTIEMTFQGIEHHNDGTKSTYPNTSSIEMELRCYRYD